MSKAFSLTDFVRPEVSEADAGIIMVDVDDIMPNELNFYSVGDVDELADSIQISGLLHPLTVYRKTAGRVGFYKIISGHRRYKAICQLREASGGKAWPRVPCSVVADPADEVREKLMLIQANSTGRILTGAEIARQAKELTECFIALKERGVELPGRVRDRVAEQMQMSASKLARVKAINERLTAPGLRQAWEDNKLNESVAYELSQLPADQQCRAMDELIDRRGDVRGATAADVKAIKKTISAAGGERTEMRAIQNTPKTSAVPDDGRGWRRCLQDEPEEGQLVAVIFPCEYTPGAFDKNVCIYHDGFFYDDIWYAEPVDDIDVSSRDYWFPLPALPKE